MFSRKSKHSSVLEPERIADGVSDLAGKTVVVAGIAAERAAQAAREARKAAAPVVRRGAHSAAGALSEAAEKAAEMFAETADRLSNSDASTAARDKLADRAEAFADALRPKKRHRIRKLLLVSAIAGGVVAVVKSPLKTKLANKLFGEPPSDDDFEAITLPVDEAPDGEATVPTSEATPTEPRHRKHVTPSETTSAN